MKIKLMLVDDHDLFLEGLKYLLETHSIDVISVAHNGREAFIKAQELKPDIILMDIKMPVCSGIDALKLIKSEMPDIKIIMLTTSDEDEDLFDAIKFGASGYLLKSTNAKTLIDMLYGVRDGEIPLSPGLAARILKEFRQKSEYAEKMHQQNTEEIKEGQLTQRQLEVLEIVARGKTYKDAGDILGISERTVKYHMGRIIELLHLENRAQVIAYAAKIGLADEIRY